MRGRGDVTEGEWAEGSVDADEGEWGEDAEGGKRGGWKERELVMACNTGD